VLQGKLVMVWITINTTRMQTRFIIQLTVIPCKHAEPDSERRILQAFLITHAHFEVVAVDVG